jgi:RHS repeat-associated protein
MDRLGSATAVGTQSVSFYPYGQDKGTAGANDSWKFATYWRDSATGLDYAMNRYYSSAMGRFLTADRFRRAARLGSPQSWNRFTYANNDPINRNDPTGRCSVVAGGITEGPGSDQGLNQLATDLGGISAFGYGNTVNMGIVGPVAGVVEVGSAAATTTAGVAAVASAILAAAQDPGPIDIFAFSGGAQDVTTALANLPASIVSRIRNIVYIDPGFLGSLATSAGATTVVQGSGFINWAVSAFGTTGTLNVINTNCNHNVACEIQAIQSAINKLTAATSPCGTSAAFSVVPLSSFWNPFLFWLDWDISEVSSTIIFEDVSSSVTFVPDDDEDDDHDDQ